MELPLSRPPAPDLRPFVARLWAATEAPAGALAAEGAAPRLERVLPTGWMHLVIRLGGAPLRVHRGGRIEAFGPGVIGGARAEAYVREVGGPSSSVGAMLLPGASALLFGAPAEALADAHTELGDLWGAEARALRDRLLACATAEDRLRALEAALRRRLPRVRALHPAVAGALALFAERPIVAPAVEASGLSHRRFVELFHREVGLTPKRFCRVRRLQRVLRAGEASWARGLASLAFEAGYADQAHLSRELKALTGLTPSAYRDAAPRHSHHVLLPRP